MPKAYSFSSQAKKYESEGTFKFKEGRNRIRILSETAELRGEYNGKPTLKHACYIIDRSVKATPPGEQQERKVKIAYFPTTILKLIGALQDSEDFSFDSVPMPYDLEITASNAGTINVEYAVNPTKITPLTSAEAAEYRKQKPIEEVLALIQAKKGAPKSPSYEGKEDDEDEIDVNDIPI